MIELIHAVITSLLLSAAAGCGVGPSTTGEDEPANSETGIEVGKLITQLTLPRDTQSPNKSEHDNDHQPTALSEQVEFCEPSIGSDFSLVRVNRLPLAVPFATAGRSP